MAKYKTGTIYAGAARVRIVDEEGAHTEVIEIGGATSSKAYDKGLRDKWDYETVDGSGFRVCKRISQVEKNQYKYRVLVSEIMECPSFEILSNKQEQ